MTRYTNLRKKTYLEASEWKSQPLVPPKRSERANHVPSKDGLQKNNTRRLRRQKSKQMDMTCFHCRERGHSVKNCPKTNSVDMCYHCGSKEHRIKECTASSHGGKLFAFAICFICQEEGHLSSQCPKNEKGLYPEGGGCRYCNSTKHLAKDCRPTYQDPMKTALGTVDVTQPADDDDVFTALKKIDEDRKKGIDLDITNEKSNTLEKKHKVVRF